MIMIRTYGTFLYNDSHHLDLNAELLISTYINLDLIMISI